MINRSAVMKDAWSWISRWISSPERTQTLRIATGGDGRRFIDEVTADRSPTLIVSLPFEHCASVEWWKTSFPVCNCARIHQPVMNCSVQDVPVTHVTTTWLLFPPIFMYLYFSNFEVLQSFFFLFSFHVAKLEQTWELLTEQVTGWQTG